MRPQDELITYSSIEDPEWLDNTYQAIVCRVKFDHEPSSQDFVARPSDEMPHGREIFQRCKRGEFGWVMPASKERIEALYQSQNDQGGHVVGDLHSNSTDAELQNYIEQHNLENRSGSERGTVVACGIILDHILKRLLAQNGITARMDFAKKIERARDEAIITRDELDHLTLIREIRNAFGHELVSLADEPQKSRCERLYADAVGDGATPSLRLQYSSACATVMGNLLPRISP